jgi:plasmid stability protein
MENAEEITSNLTIRGLPARVRGILATRAKARHLSLNSYVVEVLTQDAETPTMAQVLADLDAVRRPTGVTGDEIAAVLRAARESRDTRWD